MYSRRENKYNLLTDRKVHRLNVLFIDTWQTNLYHPVADPIYRSSLVSLLFFLFVHLVPPRHTKVLSYILRLDYVSEKGRSFPHTRTSIFWNFPHIPSRRHSRSWPQFWGEWKNSNIEASFCPKWVERGAFEREREKERKNRKKERDIVLIGSFLSTNLIFQLI